jgi:hypothetical protein
MLTLKQAYCLHQKDKAKLCVQMFRQLQKQHKASELWSVLAHLKCGFP